MNSTLYGDHIVHLQTLYQDALNAANSAGAGIEAVLLHSGSEQHYFADDRGVPFQAFGHFCHWLPLNRPDQFVYVSPGQQPIYYQVVPDDFWYDQSIDTRAWWADHYQIVRLAKVSELGRHLPKAGLAYLGAEPGLAQALGIEAGSINPATLGSHLDFMRAYKTEYEIEQLRVANRLAVTGHKAARDCFLAGGNEYAIHLAFLTACNMLEEDSPYTNIVALDEKAAILHYQYKRREPAAQSQVLLIDAGCRINGYGSDVTRTSVKQSVHPVFASVLSAMEKLEQDLVSQVRPGLAYPQLHEMALTRIAEILLLHKLCDGDAADLLQQEIPQLFMPHGVGHLLGLQVHDVGGHQRDSGGGSLAPPAHSPALRNTRELAPNMVFTIEPGFYFIPMLLEPERETSRGKLFNWPLIEALYGCGGIRVEDNVCVTDTAAENLTRQFE